MTPFEQRVDAKNFDQGVSYNRAQKEVPEGFVSFPSQQSKPKGLGQMDNGDV